MKLANYRSGRPILARMRRSFLAVRRRSRDSWWPCDDGALTLSYVIIIPVFLAGIMVIVQACVWYLARETAIGAARQGADIARTAQPPPGQGARAALVYARQAAPGFLLAPSASTAGSSASTVRVRVTGRVPSLVPGMVLTVSEVVTAPVERFTATGRDVADAVAPVRLKAAGGPYGS